MGQALELAPESAMSMKSRRMRGVNSCGPILIPNTTTNPRT
jgi:hypothetical protein